MARKLRSNYQEGTSLWAVRRAQWRALGISEADMQKPKIAVINTSSELAICFSHLDGIAKVVKEAIRVAGGLPFEVRTAAPSDFIHSAGRAGTYILPTRDLITNDIEVQVAGAQLDGMVCLTSCDKTVPGQLMAAARLDIPTIMVICGYQPSGSYKNHHMDIEEVFLGAGHYVAGKITLDELKEMSENAILGPGVCSGMGTANSMHIVTEALGMSLPGSAPVLANSERMFDFARRSGERIVQMVEEDLRPSKILTEAAYANAAMAILAVSGSINCIKHLQATAVEGKSDVNVYGLFDTLANSIPVLSAVRPIGDTSIEAFEEAGGALALMKELEQFVRKDAMTVTGKTVGENLATSEGSRGDAIRDAAHALSNKPAIVILRGSLCPDGGIVKLGLREGKKLQFSGTAICFSSAEGAINGLKDGRIKPGHVVILRGLGVQGGPGMGMASRVVFAIDGMNLGPDVAFVTDGQLSGLVNKGLVLGEVTPEAAIGGPLGLVEDGDTITIDIEARTADLDVPGDVLAARRAKFHGPVHKDEGWVSIYRRSALPLSKGAALIDPR